MTQVFAAWRQKQQEDKRRAQEEGESERKRKGILTGREIFQQVTTCSDSEPGCNTTTHMFLWWMYCLLVLLVLGACTFFNIRDCPSEACPPLGVCVLVGA